MGDYSFSTEIEEPRKWLQAGYKFCVKKKTSGGRETQWLVAPLKGGKIEISWSTEYAVFYTETAIAEGATITQTASQRASPGTAWSYSQAAFDSSTASVDSSSFLVINNTNEWGNFGLAQVGTVNGESVFSPLAVVALPGGGKARFKPSETVVIGLSADTNVPGMLIDATSASYELTLNTNVKRQLRLSATGSWVDQGTSRGGGGLGEVFKFILLLSAHVAVPILKDYIWSRVQPSTVEVIEETSDNKKYSIKVTGHGDPTPIIEALKGTKVTDTVTINRGAFQDIVGVVATFTSVERLGDFETNTSGQVIELTQRLAKLEKIVRQLSGGRPADTIDEWAAPKTNPTKKPPTNRIPFDDDDGPVVPSPKKKVVPPVAEEDE